MALLLVPLVSLVALWSYSAFNAGGDVWELLVTRRASLAFTDSVENTVRAIQIERRQSLLCLASPRRKVFLEDYRRSQRKANEQAAAFRRAAQDPDKGGQLSRSTAAKLDDAVRSLDGLLELRAQVSTGQISRIQAFHAYTKIIDAQHTFSSGLRPLDDVDLSRMAMGIGKLVRAREVIAREDAIVTAATTSGTMSAAEYHVLRDSVLERRLLQDLGLAEVPKEIAVPYRQLLNGSVGRELRTLEDRLVDAGLGDAPRAVGSAKWRTTVDAAVREFRELRHSLGEKFGAKVKPFAIRVMATAGIIGVIGLGAVIVSIVLALRIGRRLARDLSRLRTAALDLSGNRLPRLMRRLASGEELDVRAEAPPIDFHADSADIGQVGQAFNDVQRAAVEAAVKQAELRRGISKVFVNLARRSQVLLHRQLTLLDTMERRTEDSDELADLFRLDHMTTRMRRHAEGLVILSGAAPSRAWRNPVMLIDVVRAAVAEVEDYERVEVRRMPHVAIIGAAVGDVTHLLAELIENATVFSPPHTQVQVHGERVANGFVLEIDDRGLGLGAEELLKANQRLAETPEFELSDTDRLGLFVVSRLAQRHGVRVSLRPSAYGGTSAVALIPSALLTEDIGRVPAGQRITIPASAARTDPEQEDEVPADRTEDAFRQWGLGPVAGQTPPAHQASVDQHEQALDPVGDATSTADGDSRPPGSLPRRRRRSPTLVADRGRMIDVDEQHGAAADDGAPAGGSAAFAGLPRRIRQASLAPQLRDDPQDVAAARESGVRERSADEVRARMASFQRGWQRGRSEGDDVAGGAGANGDPHAQAPRTSTEEGDGR